MTYYHLTSERHLKGIERDGVIRPSESNVGSPVPAWQPYGTHVGPDVVWLLNTPVLEFNHGLTTAAGSDLVSAFDKTAVAIEVNVPAMRWLDWAYSSQMHPAWRKAFIQAGGGDEAATHWYVWPRTIRRSRWVSMVIRGNNEGVTSDER
jgi:hypothetical protein